MNTKWKTKRAGYVSDILGPVRFRTDGSCARSFAILLAGRDGYSKVAVSQGA